MKRSCLLLVSGAISIFGIAQSAFAEPVTRNTEFSVTVNPYLNVTLSSNDVHLPITPSSGGTYGSTYFTATASTNNALGYSLNLSIKDTNTAAAQLTTNLTSDTINVNDGTKPVIPTFSTNDILTSSQFSASTSADHLNHWAMSLNDTDHYKKALSESTIATSDGPIADDVTTLNLATKLDLLTPPGSYSAYFNFEIVANVITGSLEQALIDAGKTRVTVGNNQYYRIQDVDSTICNNTIDTSGTLEVVDIRDNTIYHIGKLNDGRCWLLDNLALNPIATGTTISDADTNASSEAVRNYFNGSTSALHDGWATSAIDYENNTSTQTEPRFYAANANTVSSDSMDQANGWKVGTYYNFCAATMGTYCYEGTDGIDRDDQSAIDAEYDICPIHWRMPTGGAISTTGTTAGGGEYQALYTEYNSYASFRNVLRLPLPGVFYDGSAGDQGVYGRFWSTTYIDTNRVYMLSVDGSNILPQSNNYRGLGFAVRCIVK